MYSNIGASHPRTTVENCTASIAASFPCLRPLLRAVRNGAFPSGSKSSKGQVRSNDMKPAFNLSDGAATNVEMYDRTTNKPDVSAGPMVRTESEESILPLQHEGSEGITKTLQVSVSLDGLESAAIFNRRVGSS